MRYLEHLRRPNLAILLILSGLLTTSCEDDLDIALYVLKTDREGLVRDQEDQFYSCSDRAVEGYLCVSPEDFSTLVNACVDYQEDKK